MDDKNQDLAKQYQDILDHYSAELANTNSEPPTTTENLDSPVKLAEIDQIPETTPPMITEKSPNGLPPEPEVNLPPITPPPVKTYTISTPSEPPVPPQKPSNIFKYLFFVSLLVFLGIFGSIIYTVVSNSQNKDVVGIDEPTPTEVVSNVTPTAISGSVCEVNDKTYQKGESFTAADGCNSCVCGDDLTISCTEKSCEVTPTVKANPTLKATPTLVPTKAKTSVSPTGADSPAAGICDSVGGSLVTVIIGEDNVASPRCAKVSSDQKLVLINNSKSSIAITQLTPKVTVKPSTTYQFTKKFGDIIGTGVHNIGGAEIWLQ